MAREKKLDSMVPSTEQNAPVPNSNPFASAPVVSSNLPEKLSEVDQLNLALSRAKRQIALAEAKTALANNENAELNYKYLVLQIYMKNGLTTDDAISEAGDIIRGGAVQRPQGQ
jgi:hypothetical protein